jgi:hypothetical protein
VFGLAHAADGATALGLASNALGGIMYGAAFVRTGRIWMPIGLHAAWSRAQGPVFGFTASGMSEWSSMLVQQAAVGSDLITSGTYTEGSVVVIAFRFVVVALVVLATRRVAKLGTTSLRSPRQEQTQRMAGLESIPALPPSTDRSSENPTSGTAQNSLSTHLGGQISVVACYHPVRTRPLQETVFR